MLELDQAKSTIQEKVVELNESTHVIDSLEGQVIDLTSRLVQVNDPFETGTNPFCCRLIKRHKIG